MEQPRWLLAHLALVALLLSPWSSDADDGQCLLHAVELAESKCNGTNTNQTSWRDLFAQYNNCENRQLRVLAPLSLAGWIARQSKAFEAVVGRRVNVTYASPGEVARLNPSQVWGD
jgi:hypothetical protein